MGATDYIDAEPTPDAPQEATALAIRDNSGTIEAYEGVATLVLDEKQRAKLAEILPDDEHDILPTGELYVSQVRYRRILNETFGPGSWALVPRSKFFQEEKTICREYALFVNGKFVAEAIGEQDYHQHSRMSYATAAESVKSNALMRCCKDLGIASECWDRHWTEVWKKLHAVCVQVVEKDYRTKEDKKVWRWRRKDARKLPGEIGAAPSGETTSSPAAKSDVQMPRAKSAAPAKPADDTAAKLQQSLDLISREQQVKLFASIGSSAHSELDFRSWLKATAGLDSTKMIPKSKLEAILRRVEDKEPLFHDYQERSER